MKIFVFALFVALALARTAMVEVSGFKTADQLMQDIQADKDNIYAIVFFKRDDTNFELTKSNKKYLDKMKKIADDTAVATTDENVKYVYFARVDLSVQDNKRLWEKFGLTETSCDKFPAAAITKNAGGYRVEGPAIVSLFKQNIEKTAGVNQKTEAAQPANPQ